MSDDLKTVQKALVGLAKRAEREGDTRLAETFVDAEPFFTVFSTEDNQIIYGRRGTGKTHALKYLQGYIRNRGDIVIYIDLRQMGSNTSLYGDFEIPYSQRATSICNDMTASIHDELLSIILDDSANYDLSQCGPMLDRLARAIANTKILGHTKATIGVEDRSEHSSSNSGAIGISTTVSLGLTGQYTSSEETSTNETKEVSGVQALSLIFGDIGRPIVELLKVIGKKRLWLLVDEWSEVPLDLQPLLADLIRRIILPIGAMTVKIAAIEHRSMFSVPNAEGGYLGFELGADIGADLNLDDFMVFDNDENRASEFFENLIFKHYMNSDERGIEFNTPAQLRSYLFTQVTAFAEFVRAVEGVPRDAVYLISLISQKAFGKEFAVPDVRASAREWYQRDKARVVETNPQLQELLDYIIEEVIGHRRARAFLVSSSERNSLIAKLFDMRILHVLKKNVSSHDSPGERYDVYKIDYGCYVDLINTNKSTEGLLPTDDGFLEVPPDDYRSIRRAILDVARFESKPAAPRTAAPPYPIPSRNELAG